MGKRNPFAPIARNFFALAVIFAAGLFTGAWWVTPQTLAQELDAARRTMRAVYGCGSQSAIGDYDFWWKPRDDRNCLTITQVNTNTPLHIVRLRPSAQIHIATDMTP